MPHHSDPAAAIRANTLTKSYGPVRALDGIDFQVEPGTVFGLLGPNGAGKSTTIRILTTLTTPTSGSAEVAGADVQANPAAVRRRIGVVTQRSSSDPLATGRENLTLTGRLHGLPRAQARARTAELLDRFDLTEAADRVVGTYSGGMTRKLDVAMGLAHRPRVLFLDEPTTGLDPQARADLWAEIGVLVGLERVTVLLTTHYLDEADHLADRLAIVDHGRIVAIGSPDELKSELHGDSVVAELASDADRTVAAQTVEHLPMTSDVAAEGRSLRVRVDNGAAAVPTILARLESAGIAVEAITLARPSLDDVYLRHTGRSFTAQSFTHSEREESR